MVSTKLDKSKNWCITERRDMGERAREQACYYS